jgi:hypothetical protein
MKKMMNIFMLSCKRATELIDKRSVSKLSLKENVMLHLHTSMCDACTTYQKQSRIINDLLHKHIQEADDTQVPQTTNDELKKQIISKL